LKGLSFLTAWGLTRFRGRSATTDDSAATTERELKRARLFAACVVVVSVACGLVQLGDLALDLAHALRALARFFGREILGLRLGDAKALMLNEQLLAIVRGQRASCLS
jgi:hypothetical protein